MAADGTNEDVIITINLPANPDAESASDTPAPGGGETSTGDGGKDDGEPSPAPEEQQDAGGGEQEDDQQQDAPAPGGDTNTGGSPEDADKSLLEIEVQRLEEEMDILRQLGLDTQAEWEAKWTEQKEEYEKKLEKLEDIRTPDNESVFKFLFPEDDAKSRLPAYALAALGIGLGFAFLSR